MGCLKSFGESTAGSDIDFTVRYKEEGGNYPSIADATVNVVGMYSGSEVLNFSIGNPTINGSTVSIGSDATGPLISIHIAGIETENMNGDLELYTKIDGTNTGRRKEAKGFYSICPSEA